MNSLPDLVILKIIEFCDLITRFKLERVSKRLKRLVESIWKSKASVNLRLLDIWTSDEKKVENVQFQQILISLLNRCGSKMSSLQLNSNSNFVSLRIIHVHFPNLKVLNLETVCLTPNCYRYLKEFKLLEEFALKPQNDEVKTFGVPENPEIIKYLKEAMSKWKMLKKFGIVTNSMTVMTLLVNLSSTVVDLFIGCMCITGPGCESLKFFLKSHPKLKHLRLWTKNSHDFLDSLTDYCTELESLSIYTKFIKPIDLSVFKELTEISLPSLWQSNNNVQILHKTLSSCWNLKVLRLTLGRFCTSEPLPKLTNLENVKIIDLNRTKTSKQFLESLLGQCSELIEIIIDLNEDEFQTDILCAKCSNLKRITLKNDGFIVSSYGKKVMPSIAPDSKSLKFILNLDRMLNNSHKSTDKLTPLDVVVEWSEIQMKKYKQNFHLSKFITIVNIAECW